MGELLKLAKETLGIVTTATAKDTSLMMIINSGIEDMRRVGIAVAEDEDEISDLIKSALMIYVKANFGISNPNEKAKYMEAYQLHLAKLSLSEGYKEAEV